MTEGTMRPAEGLTKRLLSCPFCGCLAWLHSDGAAFAKSDGGIGYRVECEGNCHAMTCYWHTEQQAVENWNRRQARGEPVYGVRNDQGYWAGCWNDRAIAESVCAGQPESHHSEVIPLYLAAHPAPTDEPVAFVPVHPRTGPLWANTIPSLDNDRPRYPVMNLYAHPAPAVSDVDELLKAMDYAADIMERHGWHEMARDSSECLAHNALRIEAPRLDAIGTGESFEPWSDEKKARLLAALKPYDRAAPPASRFSRNEAREEGYREGMAAMREMAATCCLEPAVGLVYTRPKTPGECAKAIRNLPIGDEGKPA